MDTKLFYYNLIKKMYIVKIQNKIYRTINPISAKNIYLNNGRQSIIFGKSYFV